MAATAIPLRGIYPYKVPEPVLVRQSLMQQLPQPLVHLSPRSPPPKPPTLSFVQRPPEHWHAGVLQALQLHCYGVDVAQQQRVVGVGGVEGGARIKGGLLGEERLGASGLGGREPVPADGNDAPC